MQEKMKKMKNDIYEYFGCSNKKELYELVENEDKKVQKLLDFFIFIKEKLNYTKKPISNFENLTEEMIKNFLIPNKNKVLVIGFNTSKNIVSHKEIDLNHYSFSDLIKDINRNAAQETVIVTNNINLEDKRIADLKQNLSICELIPFEIVKINIENNICKFVNTEQKEYIANEEIRCYSPQKDIINLFEFEHYYDFINYYFDKKIKGLNYVKDFENVKHYLKLNYGGLNQEILGFISLDENYNIKKVFEVSKGGINSSVVPLHRIMKEIQKDDKSKYIMYHNHPSGNAIASAADIQVAERMDKILSLLTNKPLLDSIIIGNYIYSIKGFLNEKLQAKTNEKKQLKKTKSKGMTL